MNDDPTLDQRIRALHTRANWCRAELTRACQTRKDAPLLQTLNQLDATLAELAALDDTACRRQNTAPRGATPPASRPDAGDKDYFLAVLSHELRNPLTPVLAALGVLERDPTLSAHGQEMVDTIYRNIMLEVRLIDDLLDLTRSTRGKLVLHCEVIDAQKLIAAVLDDCRIELEAKGLAAQVTLRAAEPFVFADAARLQQVVGNLLRNALKFTPAGGRITVDVANQKGPPATAGTTAGPRLVITIADTGMGIEPRALAGIFEAFQQSNINVTRRFGGLGLGLAIAKALTEAHHGTISAASEGPGRGAVFTVTLPTVADYVAPPECPPPVLGCTRALRILLVEDHAETRHVMARLLGEMGHHVQATESVSAAVQLANRETFDLLLTDINLPDGTGYDLLQRLGSHRPRCAVALSGHGSESDVQLSTAAGFCAHLQKPLRLEHLEAALQRVAVEL